MNNTVSGWVMIAVGFFWGISGRIENFVTCFCTALILFSLKENDSE